VKRKDFLYLSGMGIGGVLLSRMPALGSPVPPGMPLETVDAALKKKLADIALNNRKREKTMNKRTSRLCLFLDF